MSSFYIDKNCRTPYYIQLVNQVEECIKNGSLKDGEILPSMNSLAAEHGLSKETVKKAYGILVGRSMIEPRQGKGFYVKAGGKGQYQRVLIISDVHSIYKQTLLSTFQNTLVQNGQFDITVLMHNQDAGLLRYYLDRNLDVYDWYVVVPHFPLDEKTQKEVRLLLKRIPNRKLILLDRLIKDLPGNYGAVFQSFDEDAGNALAADAKAFEGKKRLNIIPLPSSLYKDYVIESLKRFADSLGLPYNVSEGGPETIQLGDVCVVLGSQHDLGLVAVTNKISDIGLEMGRDVFLICYNDFPLNELVLGGLSTLSTDFRQMGETAAHMILSGKLSKIHNPFHLIRRKTF